MAGQGPRRQGVCHAGNPVGAGKWVFRESEGKAGKGREPAVCSMMPNSWSECQTYLAQEACSYETLVITVHSLPRE